MNTAVPVLLTLLALTLPGPAQEKGAPPDRPLQASLLGGLQLRLLGPAFTSGRIADFAVNPRRPKEWYVAVACGGVWKTENNGITFKPIFDGQGSYSIGCLALDPRNPRVIWVGTGENNSQRALGYGDGVYLSRDGGRSWRNMGLKESRQIGRILVDPRDSRVVWVAAEGSVWGPGGERGLYCTRDGGRNWQLSLEISAHTGISDLAMDPRDPDVLYAAAHQRRRHVFTKIDGGPESAIYKTVDGGRNWRRLAGGLPGGDLGAIGLALSPADPDRIHAIIELPRRKGGFWRSRDRGESWEKMSDLTTTSPQYYNEIYCDPRDPDRLYSMDTFTRFTTDGGRTWHRLGNRARHVDDHALWIDPADPEHLLIGGDGGIYETWDLGRHWQHKSNLPVTQFYRVAVDQGLPFYSVYGGTQDNNSMGGPSRTLCRQGIRSCDWFLLKGGDGFWCAVDPRDPRIVYAESQYGGMVRYDRQSGETIAIKPMPPRGGEAYRWNWNTPLIISPHRHTRLYAAANRLFRSEDRGDRWQVVSPDLTRQLDRDKLPVMGRVWGVDAVAKNASTSLYGTIVSLAESPKREDLVLVGTDDGLVQVSEAPGSWRRIDTFPGVPEFTYVSDICPSRHDERCFFVAFDNRKRDDFKPYLLRTDDLGRSWRSVTGDLPANGTVHTLVQDPVRPELLFAGTEFGLWCTLDGGSHWLRLKNGLPTIAVRDLVIQERECDLVLGTFGRGIYVLDDYSALRALAAGADRQEARIFPVGDALAYIPRAGKHNQGSTYYAAPNPPFGAAFDCWLPEIPLTLRQERQRREKALAKAGKPIPHPGWEALRAEEEEAPPRFILTITGPDGGVVARPRFAGRRGLNRVHWNLRVPPTGPDGPGRGAGHPVMPGTYRATLGRLLRGREEQLAGPVPFRVVPLANVTLPAPDRAALWAFQERAARVHRVVQGTIRAGRELADRLTAMARVLPRTRRDTTALAGRITALQRELGGLLRRLSGDPIITANDGLPPVSLTRRLHVLVYTHNSSTAPLTAREKEALRILTAEFTPIHARIARIRSVEMGGLEAELEGLGAPWTPGRLPRWPLPEEKR